MQIDEEVLTCALNKVLDARQRIDAQTHGTHHQFVAQLIEERRRRRERWEKVRVHVYGWGVVTALGGVTYALGDWAREVVKNLLKAKGGP